MTLVGLILLVSGVCSAITQMFTGTMSDRLGRRPLVLVTLFLSIFFYLLMSVLIGISAPVYGIVLAYVGVRSAMIMTRPVISAIVVDLSPPERLTETYGLLRVGQNLGWAAGPAAGGYLAVSLPYAWLFGFAGLTGAVSLCLIYFFLKESFGGTSEPVNIRNMFSPAKDRKFLEYTLLNLLIFLVMGQMISTLSVFSVDRAGFSTAQFGFLLTLNGIIVALFQYPVTAMMGSMKKASALILGSILYGLGYLSMSWVGSFALAIIGMIIVTAGEVVIAPTTLAVAGEFAPENLRGRYMGFFGLSETLGLSFGPMLGGILLDAFPHRPLFIWGTIAVVALIAALGFLRWGRSKDVSKPGKFML